MGALEARVAGEHRTFSSLPAGAVDSDDEDGRDESANLAAELNLLNSTFAVLGDRGGVK